MKLQCRILSLKVRLIWHLLLRKQIEWKKQHEVKKIVNAILSSSEDVQEQALKYIEESDASSETKEAIKKQLEKARRW